MNILLLGAGGREHAFAQKISKSAHCEKLFIAPGNPGTAQFGENITITVNDFEAIGAFCKVKNIQMVVVGPEDPLVNGIFDYFKSDIELSNIIVVGPSAAGAQLEGSKAFAKAFMERHGIPTAAYREFNKSSFEEGVSYLRNHTLPIVLKADGLAAGKGVVIAQTHDEALHTFEEMIQVAKDNNCQIVVQTKPYGNKPGAWYIKAKTSDFVYYDLKSKIIQNSQAYSTRICYLIKY